MKWNNIIAIISISAVTIAGCKKFVDVDLPLSQLSTESTFSTDSKANSAMRGIYASMNSVLSPSPLSGPLTAHLGLYSDELEKTTLSADPELYFNNNVAPDNGMNGTMWARFYSTIFQANNAILNLEKSPGLSVAGRERMLGEARFLRAWGYFYLTNLYDSVPLLTTPNYVVNAVMPRSAPDKVQAFILEDLTYAEEHAGDQFTLLGGRGRANTWAASALMARVYLYAKEWEKAEEKATRVISSGYYVMDPLDSTFLNTARESIMVLTNAGSNIYTSEASQIQGGQTAVNPNYRFSTYTDAAFEANDLRLAKWTKVGGNGSRGPAKYKTFLNTQAGAKKEAMPMFRLAEQHLIRAEARAMRNNLSGAIEDIDSVRRRADLPLLSITNPGITRDDLLKAIMKERQTELFAEQAHRWFDLKRTGQANTLLSVRKTGWRSEAIFFPIPLRERQTNPNLGQNPGYE